MTMLVKAIRGEREQDNHQNWRYWVTVDGFNDGVLVSHRGDKPLVNPGDDLADHGYDRIEEVPNRAGTNTYLKALRPEKQGFGGGGNRGDLSPEAQARIDAVGRIKGRCHAQAVAASMLAASGDLAELPFSDPTVAGAFLNGVFRPLVNWLVADADTARQEPTPAATGSTQGVMHGNGN